MERRRLGNSALAITPIGLGASAIGGSDWILGWGPQPDAQSVATIKRALDWGINWIDTAAVYGLGHSETIIARALRDVPRRDRPLVFTKGGHTWDDLGNVSYSLAPASIRREVERSLRRLEVDAIDLHQLDLPAGPPCPFIYDPAALDEAWETLAALQREGTVRFIGVASTDATELDRLGRIAPVTSLQAPYSLLRREIERATLPYCDTHRIGVVVHSPMAAGLLTGAMTPDRLRAMPHNDWRRCDASFQRAASTQVSHLVERLRTVAARHDCVPGLVALAWTLRHPAVTAAAVGARRPDQIDQLIGAVSFGFDSADVNAIERRRTPGRPRRSMRERRSAY